MNRSVHKDTCRIWDRGVCNCGPINAAPESRDAGGAARQGEAVAPEAKPDAWQSRWYNSDPAHARVGWSEWTQLSQQAGESLQDAARRWRGRICDTFEIRPLFAAPPAPPAPLPYPQNLTPAQADARQKLIGLGGGRVGLDDDYEPPAPLPGKENLALLQQAYDALDSMGGFGFTQKASKAMHELHAAITSAKEQTK